MLLQRLVKDDRHGIGFNYDYMGYAEYEFGSTTKSRGAIAQAFLDGKLKSVCVNLVEVFGRSNSKPIEVVVIAHEDAIQYVEHQCAKDANKHWHVSVDKSSMRGDSEKIVGWLSVHIAQPFFIIKTSLDDRGQRFEQFINPFLEQIRESA